jgi:hypothetical protein
MTAPVRQLLDALRDGGDDVPPSPLDETAQRAWARLAREAAGPERVADLVFAAVRDGRFYILTHPAHNALIQQRTEAIVSGRDPANAFALLAADQP